MMGKALPGKLFCTWTGLVVLSNEETHKMFCYVTVLGHRPQTPESRRTLSLGDKHRHRITTCSRIETKRLETLFHHFEEVCR